MVMRVDAASALETLGNPKFVSLVDFKCSNDGAVTTIEWLSGQAQPSEATINAVTAQQIADHYKSKDHPLIIAKLGNGDINAKLTRATHLYALDGYNLLANRITAILDAIDNGANLAAVKTAIAAINNPPTVTKAEAKTAITAKVNAGEVDT